MAALYDQIGTGYGAQRQPEERWQAIIEAALGEAATVLNVGAGAGSYESSGRQVLALEPAWTMIAQRRADAAPVVCGRAEALPFPDGSFEAATAFLTVHHWQDLAAGVEELRRVAPKQLVLTWDAAVFARFWLIRDYLPEIAEREAGIATLSDVLDQLPGAAVSPMPVPADCTDGVLGAFWRRPEAYLDPAVRGAASGLALLDDDVVASAMKRLSADLESGRWRRANGALLGQESLDLGYRLVVAKG